MLYLGWLNKGVDANDLLVMFRLPSAGDGLKRRFKATGSLLVLCLFYDVFELFRWLEEMLKQRC